MKLNEIDVLVSWRQLYHQAKADLVALQTKNMATAPNFGGQVFGEPAYQNAIKQAIKQALLSIAEKRLEEAKTKLMMLGVTEFPE